MAYMSQEKKAKLAPAIKRVLTKYGVKGTLRVDHHTSLDLNISEGLIDFYNDMASDPGGNPESRHVDPKAFNVHVNQYWLDQHWKGKALDFLKEVVAAMNGSKEAGVENHDRSDIMTDYFDVGWYININIGKWNKPYKLIK